MKKGLIQVFIANIISLIIGLVTNFVVPKYLSIDSYAMYKTYALYITFAGFFTFGYNDGMYLKYGGKNLKGIDCRDLSNNYKNYFFLILLSAIVFIIIGVFTQNYIIIAFAIGEFSTNIVGYLQSLYQATGEFGAYSGAMNFQKICVFLLTVFFLIIIRSDNYLIYVGIQVVVVLFTAFYLTGKLEKTLHFLKEGGFSFNEYKKNISSGIILMLGNFSSSIFTGLDRWFVKFLMSSTSFALYSFGSSLLNLLNVFISPITISLYNYFCKDIIDERIIKLKRLVLAWGLLLIAAAYPVKFILIKYLDKYLNANNIIFVLFCAQIFVVIIQGVYVNLYKAKQQQKRYLLQIIVMLVVGLLTNAGFYFVHRSMEAFAWATLITYIVWFLICEIKSTIRYNLKEYIAICILATVFLVTGYLLHPVLGLLVYLVSYLMTIKFLLPDVLTFAISNMHSVIKKGQL